MQLLPTQEITSDFAAMWRAAARHVNAQLQGASHAWLRLRLESPMLEHLSIRLGNQLFFIRLEDVDEVVQGPASRGGLLTIADACHGHPCVMRMRHSTEGWRTASPGWGLVDARTGALVNPPALVTDALIEMTDWEVQEFAVDVVRDSLEREGREVWSSQGSPQVNPALWFTGDHGPEWVVVRAVRHPPGDVPVPRNWREMESAFGGLGGYGSLATVVVVNASDDPTDRSKATPLWRGYPMQAVYEGLARVHMTDAQMPEGPAALVFWPTVDDDEMAADCREALDVPRARAAELGRSAVAAIRDGGYHSSSGEWVDWRALVEAAVGAKVSLPPDGALPVPPARAPDDMRVTVANDTTLHAARRLIDLGYRPLALNFANGIEPGGGFVSGAGAQEETLCRSSALYATLEGDAMYAHHRARPRPDSTAWAILSPDVPVFRTDAGDALEQPWPLSVITCAAPYAPRVGQPESGDLLAARIHRVLAIARAYGYDALVLGAWGCGAFGNDVERTAADFKAALQGEFEGAFREVVFAIADWSPERRFLGPFRDAMWRP